MGDGVDVLFQAARGDSEALVVEIQDHSHILLQLYVYFVLFL